MRRGLGRLDGGVVIDSTLDQWECRVTCAGGRISIVGSICSLICSCPFVISFGIALPQGASSSQRERERERESHYFSNSASDPLSASCLQAIMVSIR